MLVILVIMTHPMTVLRTVPVNGVAVQNLMNVVYVVVTTVHVKTVQAYQMVII